MFSAPSLQIQQYKNIKSKEQQYLQQLSSKCLRTRSHFWMSPVFKTKNTYGNGFFLQISLALSVW